MARLTIRVDPRGSTTEIDIEDGTEPPARIEIDNGLVGVFDRIDADGVAVYIESVEWPKGAPLPS